MANTVGGGGILMLAAMLLSLALVARPALEDELLEKEMQGTLTVAQGLARQMALTLRLAEQELRGLGATLPGVKGEELDLRLTVAEAATPFFRSFTVLDSRGIIEARPAGEDRVGEDRSDREYFAAVRGSDAFHISAPRIAVTGDLSLHGSLALSDGRVIMGSFGLADRNPDLYEPILSPNLPQGWRVGLITEDGVHLAVMGSTAYEIEPSGVGHEDDISRLARAPFVVRHATVDVDEILAVAVVDPWGWRVAVTQPTETALAALQPTVVRVALVVTALFGVMAVVAFLALRQLAAPLGTLTRALRGLGDVGDAGPIPVAGVGEVRAATTAFNRMLVDRQARMAALSRSQQEFRDLFEESFDAICVMSVDGRVFRANPAFRAHFRLGPSTETVPSALDAFVEPGEAEALRAQLSDAGRVTVNGVRLRRADGSEFRAALSVGYLTDGQGRRAAILSVVRDITREVAREEAMRRSQRLETAGRLASGLAHDFNNILTVVLGNLNFLLNDDDSLSERARRTLDDAVDAGEQGAELVRQLFAVGRSQVQRVEAVDLNGVLRDLRSLVEGALPSDIDVRFEFSDEPCVVEADRSQLGQVVMNLVVNARDAMQNGGSLVLCVKRIALGSEVVGVSTGEWCVLSATDTGMGIDETTMARIFEPFFTTKEEGTGTGLGLATLHGIVTQNRGHVRVESEVGVGTTFRVFLPPHAAQEPVVAAAGVGEGAAAPVMLVEDTGAVRAVMKRTLEDQGYRVEDFRSGPEALRWLADHDGALQALVCDAVLPGPHGRDVADAVTRSRPGTPVLFVSAHPPEELASEFGWSPGDGFLQKPFAPTELAQSFRAVVGAAGVGDQG